MIQHLVRDRECRKRADSAPTRVASGRTEVQAKPVIPLRARNRALLPKAALRQRLRQRLVSAISGISGVGEKPSSARPREQRGHRRSDRWIGRSLASDRAACSPKLLTPIISCRCIVPANRFSNWRKANSG